MTERLTPDEQWLRDHVSEAIADLISEATPISFEQMRQKVMEMVAESLTDAGPEVTFEVDDTSSDPTVIRWTVTGPRDVLAALGFDVPPPKPVRITLHFDLPEDGS